MREAVKQTVETSGAAASWSSASGSYGGRHSPPFPPPAAGFVRFYHGGEEPTSGGQRWLTPSEEYARRFRAPEGNGKRRSLRRYSQRRIPNAARACRRV